MQGQSVGASSLAPWRPVLTARRMLSIGMIVPTVAACGGDDRRPQSGREQPAVACRDLKFDTTAWVRLQNPDLDGRRVYKMRKAMARDVVRCRLLKGRRRTDVRRLLGEPGDSAVDYMEYYLAPEEGPFAIDDVLLFVGIENGRVVTAEVASG